VKVLILAGGRGLRLWPYSTERLPKQFLKIDGRDSSFSQAITRALAVCSPEDIFISSNKENFSHIKRQLRGRGLDIQHVLIKEEDYETGMSILLAVQQLKSRFGVGDDEVVAVFPSDHSIDPLAIFKKNIAEAVSVASQGHIVALGKKPSSPQESFGYILLGKGQRDERSYRVERFVEKPQRSVAEGFIAQGACFWNLGIYFFPVGLILKEFCDYFHVENSDDLLMDTDAIGAASRLSFDTMIAERAKDMVAIEAEFDWLDMGSWKAVYTASKKDPQENANLAGHIFVNAERSMALGYGKPIIAIHTDNLLVVDYDNATLIVPEDHVDELKKAMPLINERYPHLTKGRPFVSVCTVFAGNKEAIEATVQSVSQQSYPLIEHIVVNNAESAKAGDELSEGIAAGRGKPGVKDEKVVDVIPAEDPAAGKYDALNQAVREATGEIVGILNAGDCYADEGVIREVVETMEREKMDVCWGDLLYLDEGDAKKVVRFWQSSPHREGAFKKGWAPPHPAVFMKRHVYEKYGYFRTDLPISATYEHMLRVLEKAGVKSCYMPRVLVKMRGGGGGLKRITHIVKGNLESYRAWKINGLAVSPWFMFAKPLSKFNQLFTKSRSIN
jgi:mannose-1-phosphate guanylyltransferase/mannose-6-phosphate isomerase